MKILQVVTLVSPDNAYGGPLRVAVNQARALAEQGHEVTVVAGATGFADLDAITVGGISIRGFAARTVSKRLGFAGLMSPSLQRWLRGNISSFDVAHIHFARDLIAIPATRVAMKAHKPFVLQPHGMVDRSDRALAKILDVTMTKRLLEHAWRVLFLTERERGALHEIAPSAVLQRLVNGVPTAGWTAPASPNSGAREVLFLARLHARKNPVLFARAAAKLARRYPEARFSVVGPDEGEATALREMARPVPQLRVEPAVGPDDSLTRISRASIYALPSVDEPFPMSVLEAMSVGKPVIITDSCGLAPDVAESAAGIVITPDEQSLVGAIDRLLSDPEWAAAAGQRGRGMTEQKFSMAAVASKLVEVYRAATKA